MMRAKPVGLYVHIPFCIKKCSYCDFCSFDNFSELDINEYINALCEELLRYKKEPKITVDTVFFGGGTPSVIPEKSFRKIVDTINCVFNLDHLFEFTVEVNPKTLTKEKISEYISCGVNRISIGLQSIHENELKKLGRIHNYEDFLHTYQIVNDAGIGNINVDLMYGIPEQSIASFTESLKAVVAIKPQHLSVYSLILEEDTPLYNTANSLKIPSEDEVCDMYYKCTDVLAQNGYIHYEISNYAKPGFECAHNKKYWNTDEYIGVGISAHSYFCGNRFFNDGNRLDRSTLQKFSAQKNIASVKRAEDTEPMYEYVMLRTRLGEGIVFSDFEERFGFDFRVGREEKIRMLCKNGLAECDDKSFHLTDRGFLVSNSVLAEIL